MNTLAPFAALIITYGTLSPTFGAVAASRCQLKINRIELWPRKQKHHKLSMLKTININFIVVINNSWLHK